MISQKIYSLENLRSDLKLLGVREGADLIVHVSLRSLGKVEGGYRAFLESLLAVVGVNGTIVTPSFNYKSIDPAYYSHPPDEDALEDARRRVRPFDVMLSQSQEGSFGDIVRLDIRGTRSDHPVKAWSAIGSRSIEYTENVSLGDVDGSNCPIGRIYNRENGQILLIGVDHDKNTSLHLAEALAGSSHYKNRTIRYMTKDDTWEKFQGLGGCSRGFHKIRGLIDFTKYEIRGKVGNSHTILLEQKPFVDAAMNALKETPWGIICDMVYCLECAHARKIYGLPPLEEKEYHLRHPWADQRD